MPLSFVALAEAGVVYFARNVIRGLSPTGPVPGTGPVFRSAMQSILRVGRATGAVDYETARSIYRRAAASLNAARRIEEGGGRIPRAQHGFDPSFRNLPTREYVYRTIVVCRDEGTGREVRTPVDVESDRTLNWDEIQNQALTGFARGATTLTPHKSDFNLVGSCADPRVLLVFAVRSTE